jgi:hypothetical protein
MNLKRVVVAGVVAWMVSLALGFLIDTVLFAGIFAANASVMRPDADFNAKLPLGLAFLVVGYIAFAYVYAKGYEGGNGIVEGARFGILVAILVNCFGIVWQYVMFPINITMAMAMLIDQIVEMAIYGAIVGAIYRPLTTARARTVPV